MNKLSIAGCAAALCALLACGIYLWIQPPPQSGPANPDVKTVSPAASQNPGPAVVENVRQPAPTDRRGGQGNNPGGRPNRDANPTAGGPPGFRPGSDQGGMPRDRGQFRARESTTETLASLAQASLNPDFDLTTEQKEKIQAISEEAKAASKWRAEHAAELSKLEEDMRNARDDGNREELELLTQKQQDLTANMPKSEDLTAKIKAVLTPEQLKILEAAVAENRPAGDQRRPPGGGMFGGGRGGAGGGRGGGPGGNMPR